MAPAIIRTIISNVARWFAQQPPCGMCDGFRNEKLSMSATVWFTSQNSSAQGECQVLQCEYLIGVEETQNCNGQLGEEDQRQAEGELQKGGH